ncbi:peptidylprolyl isomerase [Prolixibacter sp. NT017]|uniref:peptidylprolyl isomerase n=1 Tax=Prolixibacter sp. NT017 TaxID=2652390 RepID=UPI0012859DD9|nr:peptidylprolyl isomerase [Prolixibacter sp. NT017]GET27475.1 peptidyl-prolyl cis-trans isomerase [Prolixibacter sp. NT017]
MKTFVFAFLLVAFSACQNEPVVEIQTTLGNIQVELYPDKAPVTANNFLQLVEDSVYTDAEFYRTVRMNNQPHNQVKIEVIQGGLFADSLVDKIPTIPHETTQQTGIRHKNGVISMARNKPGSASSEFFICIGDQPALDYGGKRNPDGQGFAAFGKVIKGMNVVKQIQMQPDTSQYLIHPVTIIDIKRIK